MSEKIICRIYDTPKMVIKFGSQGLKGDVGPTGPAGTTDHVLLEHLDYDNAGHTNFQKKLVHISEYKAFLVE